MSGTRWPRYCAGRSTAAAASQTTDEPIASSASHVRRALGAVSFLGVAIGVSAALGCIHVKWNQRKWRTRSAPSSASGGGLGRGRTRSLYLCACPHPSPPAEVGCFRLRPINQAVELG